MVPAPSVPVFVLMMRPFPQQRPAAFRIPHSAFRIPHSVTAR